MNDKIRARWQWSESAGGKHFIYAEGLTHPLLVLNMAGTTRADMSYTKVEVEQVLQHIVTAHNVYLDNLKPL